MGKRYKSVSDMARRLSADAAFAKRLEQEIAAKELAKTLFAMRCARGMSQKDMASKLGCTQSRISKLEHSGAEGIRVSDLVAYAQALGLNLRISFQEDMTPVEHVKFHAFQIKRHLDRLAALAHRDDKIFEGVKDFYTEYLVNMLRLFRQSAERLPKPKTRKGPVLQVNAPGEIAEQERLLLGD